MASSIERDFSRAREIIRDKVRKDLRKYISHSEMIGRRGKDLISIPVPGIDIPDFRFGKNIRGVGQGDGEPGTPIGRSRDDGGGGGQAGGEPGEHITEEFSLEELAQMLGEELELPALKPKSRRRLLAEGHRYSGAYPVGPASLLIRKRTMKEAMLRSLASVEPPELVFAPDFILADFLTIIPPDKRYRLAKPIFKQESVAVIVYILDVSGSMADEMKEIVRTMCRWIEIWIDREYKGSEKRYIIHDAAAREVSEEVFYHTRESGGTRISSAYQVAAAMVNPRSGYQSPFGGIYDAEDWNIYIFQFSDGDNWGDDDKIAEKWLKEELLPKVNLLGYAQVESPYGSGEFINLIKKASQSFQNVTCAEVNGKDGIYDGIRGLLGKKRGEK